MFHNVYGHKVRSFPMLYDSIIDQKRKKAKKNNGDVTFVTLLYDTGHYRIRGR